MKRRMVVDGTKLSERITMNNDEEWNFVQGFEEGNVLPAKTGAMRVALLFGSIAVAFALFLVPIVSRSSQEIARANVPDLDLTATGAVSRAGNYTIRRSVLQSNAKSICIIRSNGSSVGDC